MYRFMSSTGTLHSFGERVIGRNLLVFFFSSRRRHTRSLCDWSSDVCSSDLAPAPEPQLPSPGGVGVPLRTYLRTLCATDSPSGRVRGGSDRSFGHCLLSHIFVNVRRKAPGRSEERRVGKEGRFGWAPKQ